MEFLSVLQRWHRGGLVTAGIVLVCVIGIIDYLTGYEVSFSAFYVIPIGLVTWLTNRRIGLALAVFGALAWLTADLAAQHPYTHPLIPAWNTLIRFAFFVIIALLLAAQKKAIERESELARTDFLTGAINSRFFYQLAQMEIDRAQRRHHPFTIAYVDLDNFKAVNDRFGHMAGDEVLKTTVAAMQSSLRKSDIVARLGGDEFVVLLPETDQAAARTALANLKTNLSQAMREKAWPVTFSIGALTCLNPPATVEVLLKQADDLMYRVKNEGKDAIRFALDAG